MALQFGPDPRLEYSRICKILILLNVGVYLLGVTGDITGINSFNTYSLLKAFGLFPASVVHQGMFWTPFTYMFLHGGAIHLVFNMLAIYLLGPDLEQTFGRKKFLGIYLLSGWLGGIGFVVISYLIQGQLTPCVGASGAIFGLLGGIVALFSKRIYVILPVMIPIRASVLATLLLSTHLFFIFTPYGNHVAYEVHLIGGLSGFLLCGAAALIHRYRWKDVIPVSEIPFVAVELETLAYKLARDDAGKLAEEDLKRYAQLKEALRFEDIPSVEEIRAQKS